MPGFIHIVEGDFDAFAAANDLVGDEFSPLNLAANTTTIQSAMPGARSLSSWKTSLDALDHRIDLREKECHNLSANARQAQANYAARDVTVKQAMDAVAQGGNEALATSAASIDLDRLRERLGG